MVITQNGQDIAIEMDTPLLCNDPEVLLDATRQGLGIGRIFTHNMRQQPDQADFIPRAAKTLATVSTDLSLLFAT